MAYLDTELGRQRVAELVREIYEYDKAAISDDEKAVAEQHTIFYKWYCAIVYGHLEKKGVCLRCGKVINKK